MEKIKSPAKIDLLNNLDREEIKNRFKFQRPKKSKKGKIFLFVTILLIFFLVSFFSPIIISTRNVLKTFGSGSFLGIWQTVTKLISAKDKLLTGEDDDRINILVVGVGGKGHDGPYLTDSIMLVSIKPSEKKIATISIPRDLYAPIPGYSWNKINTAYAFGEANGEKGGELLSNVAENVFGIPIHYYIACDFNGFKKMIDIVGGIDIYVEKGFTDNQYPTDDFKTTMLSFQQGQQKMSGDRALKFVRSRHGNNNEGSDFARSKRQQKVISALKSKFFSLGTLANPSKISDFLDVLSDNIKTDIELYEILRLANIIKSFDNANIISKVLDNGSYGPLYSDISADGAYILKPKAGNFKELVFIAKNIFNESIDTDNDQPLSQKTKLIVQNGTTYPGLAFNASKSLESLNFQIVQIGNAFRQDYEQTIIYDLTQGKKKESLDILEEKLDIQNPAYAPDYLEQSDTESQADFLIILGKNSIPVSYNATSTNTINATSTEN